MGIERCCSENKNRDRESDRWTGRNGRIAYCCLRDGHVLIEGVPGVAKTLTAKLPARSIDVPSAEFSLLPDLMPSDVIGTSVFNPQTAFLSFQGPYSNIVLIDEINRSPAKTTGCFFYLRVMEERQVTYDGVTYAMPQPFMVLATQNQWSMKVTACPKRSSTVFFLK